METLLLVYANYFRLTWAAFWTAVGAALAIGLVAELIGVKSAAGPFRRGGTVGFYTASKIGRLPIVLWVVAVILMLQHFKLFTKIKEPIFTEFDPMIIKAMNNEVVLWAAAATALILFAFIKPLKVFGGKKPKSLAAPAPQPGSVIGFASIGGYMDVKGRIAEAVSLTLSDKPGFKPNGIILFGPPGCGKTIFAEKTAEEFGIPFKKVHIDEIKSMWINQSSEKLGEVFKTAMSEAPCVLFFDEMEGLISNRKNVSNMHAEDAKVTNAFLTHMDDIRRNNLKVIVMGATNYYDRLDKASVRRGRFDYHVKIDYPDKASVEGIIETVLRKNLPVARTEPQKAVVPKKDYPYFTSAMFGLFLFLGVVYSLVLLSSRSIHWLANYSPVKTPQGLPALILKYPFLWLPLAMTFFGVTAVTGALINSRREKRAAAAQRAPVAQKPQQPIIAGMAKLVEYFEGRSAGDIESAINMSFLSDTAVTADMIIETDKENKRLVRNSVPNVPWSSVILNETTMNALKSLCEYIKNYKATRAKYTRPLKGLMLHGEPGCGKTLIAKALASNADCSFYSLKPSDIMSGAPGESEARIEEIYLQARAAAPSIVFIDEAESLFESRDTSRNSSAVNQILSEIDGFAEQRDVVFTVFATNYPNKIDEAIKSRLSHMVHIPKPDRESRKQLFKLFISEVRHQGPFYIDQLADITAGKSARDIENLINLAAANELKSHIGHKDIIDAVERQKGTERPTTIKRYTWDDLIVSETVLKQLKTMENVFRHPDKAQKLGLVGGMNAIFSGPPGTGKTFAAKVLANVAKADFRAYIGGDFRKPYVGESEKMISEAFQWLRSRASAILFIDEAEGLLMDRSRLTSEHSASFVNQFLAEMQGFKETGGITSVMIATNIPDSLDPAVLSRFQMTVRFDPPSFDERVRLFSVYLKDIDAAHLDIVTLARHTEGYSGRDIVEKVIKNAKINALYDGRDKLTMQDFEISK